MPRSLTLRPKGDPKGDIEETYITKKHKGDTLGDKATKDTNIQKM